VKDSGQESEKEQKEISPQGSHLFEKYRKFHGLRLLRGKKKYLEFKLPWIKFKIPKRILNLCLLLLIVSLGIVIWINHEKLMPDKIIAWIKYSMESSVKGAGFPLELSGTKVDSKNFLVQDKNLLILSDTSLRLFNDTAKKLSEHQHNFTKPILKLGGSNMLIFNLQGKDFKIATKFSEIAPGSLEEHILTGAISADGNYSFITETKGYFSKMTVYSKRGEEIYQYYFSDHFINGTALNKDGNRAAVVGTSAEEGTMKSALYVFDYSEHPVFKSEFSENIFFDVKFFPNGNIVAVGDKLTTVVNIFSGEKQDYLYEEKVLTTFDIGRDGAVLSLSENFQEKNCELIVLDREGHVKQKIPTGLNLTAISYNNNKIAALCDGKLGVYSSNGENLALLDVAKGLQQVRLASDKSVYLLGRGEVSLLNF
jgi:hypothetical protein